MRVVAIVALLAAAPAYADDDGEVITVTGASPEHDLFVGREPVSVITKEDLADTGRATLGDVLQTIPAQANGTNAQDNANGDGTTHINLRGLGVARTLVLINGRRVVNGGAGADTAVDLNIIPLAMVERVEVIKDGASTLYGADAVGGVVNVITRPQFDGTDVTLLGGMSEHGDGAEYDASAVTGFTTEDRHTYFVISAGYQGHQSVFAGDRHFSQDLRSYDFASGTEHHYLSLATPNGRLDATGLTVPGCTASACMPDGHGGFTNFTGGYNEAAESYLYTPSTRYNAFATAGRKLSPTAELFLEALYLHRDSDRALSPVAFNAYAPISKDSIYNPLGVDVLDYRRRMDELGDRKFVDEVGTFRMVAGISGTLPSLGDWKYEVSANFGATQSTLVTPGQLYQPRLADATGPSMLDAAGTPICVRVPGDPSTKIVYVIRGPNGTTTTIPCVPLNLMSEAGQIPQAQLKNLTFADGGNGNDRMTVLLATAQGTIAHLPGDGSIYGTAGVDYRNEVGNQAPPDIAGAGESTAPSAQATNGKFSTEEAYAEAEVVPLVDAGLVKRLELDLGARLVHHSEFGTDLTYKASGLFRSDFGLALRASYATAWRAPTVRDLIGGQTQTTPSVEDPCDTRPPSLGDGTKTLSPTAQAACTAQGVPVGSRFNTTQQLASTGGNPDLIPEKAATAMAGLVYEPPIKGLALSVDYWHIAIRHAIEVLPVATIFANCYDRGEQAFCDEINRDRVTHQIDPVDQSLQNVDRVTTSGVDAALLYDGRFKELGRIRAALEAQYLITYDVETANQVIHGAGNYDLGVFPHVKANLATSWTHPSGWGGGFILRYIGSFKECASDDCNLAGNASREVSQYAKLDLFATYDFSALGKTRVQLGVNNVGNATPPLIYNAPANASDAATYDFVGRFVYVRIAEHF